MYAGGIEAEGKLDFVRRREHPTLPLDENADHQLAAGRQATSTDKMKGKTHIHYNGHLNFQKV